MSFKNKVVLITGASSGIGAATAIEFAKEGAKIAIVARNVGNLKNVAEKCEAYDSKPLLIAADISEDDKPKEIIRKVIDEFGQLDVLVNNAGLAKYGCILEGNFLEAYDATMKINVRAHINVIVQATPHLIKTKGNIINISSAAGSVLPRHAPKAPYYVSKATFNHFTRCAALELSSQGVRVNTVSPGPVKTEFLVNAGDTSMKIEDMAAYMPLKRISEPIEIVNTILFLASDKAVGVTGSEYFVDNGCLLR